MNTHWRTAGLIAAVIMVGSAGQAISATNLIQNGDFEEPVLSSSLAFFADGEMPGWTIEYSSSDTPEREPLLEVWNHLDGLLPYSGSQHVELDGYDTVKISQNVATVPGKHYVLTYAWAPRPGVADNQMKVWVNGEEVGSHAASGVGQSAIQWTQATYEFDAVSTATSIAFAEVGPNEAGGGVGMLLDAVSLEESANPCEGQPMDVTGIILTRAGALNDQAQIKLKHVTGIKAAAQAAVAQGKPVTFKIGSCGAPPIGVVSVPYPNTYLNLTYLNLRYTVGNLDMLRCVFNTEECVLNLKGIDFDTTVLPGVLGSDVIVTLEVGDTVYVDSIPGGWREFDSGAPGNWTKYRKD